jgi:hypothetical protein
MAKYSAETEYRRPERLASNGVADKGDIECMDSIFKLNIILTVIILFLLQ